MLVEWYFLVSVMTGTFEPATGWEKTERFRVTAPTEQACVELRDLVHADLKDDLPSGSALVITGCQPVRP